MFRSARSLLVPVLLLTATSAALAGTPACRTLTAEEAAAVLGPAPELRTALEGGGCIYVRGGRTLTVAQPIRYESDPRVVVQAYEAQMASQHGKPLAGVGDRAFLAKGNSGYRIGFLAAGTFGGLEVYGDGTDDPEVGRNLEVAAKAVVGRL